MGQQTRIVLIDDDQDACELLKMQLEDTGRIDVTYTTRSDEALSIIRRELPDLAILDINMPGIHGVEIGSALAAEPSTSAIPILYLSGMVTPEEAKNLGQGEGESPLISKGSPVEELIAAIDNLTTS
ncbi:MAG: response regulator [Proteobacteria bacterium]|nr:response regulator [Pseudomonadota bacterium]MBU1139825.1 response regulator [Pseudomonadota bacterium]MBU1234550.1 response regulator [Pseudomonadota bacterium]MBU1420825.1 response regulator [Pseudomonadota bacterium]MBU1454583.1 response regulator [Pseudomonadota bacterium]